MIRELLKVELTLIQVSSASGVVFVAWTIGIENVESEKSVCLFHAAIGGKKIQKKPAMKKTQCGH